MNVSDLHYPNILKVLAKYQAQGHAESAAFLCWFLENIFRLDDVTARDAICDRVNDKGIDGIWVDTLNESVVFFQSKIRQANDRTIGDNDLKNFMGSLAQFQTANTIEEILKGNANTELKNIISTNKIVDLVKSGYKVRGVFISNATPDQNTIEYLRTGVPVDLFDIDRICQECVDIDVEGGIAGTFDFNCDPEQVMTFSAGAKAKVILLSAKASDLIRMPGISDGSLFSRNVRLALGNTSVNKDIAKTLSQPSEHILFPLYHNGITMLCDSAERIGTSIVRVKTFAVVNGAQSLTVLYERRADITTDLRVFLKIVEISGDAELAGKITINSNNQNAIKPRDMRSNHHLQVRLKTEFSTFQGGQYAFEVKRGEVSDPKKKVISNDEAGRWLLAFDVGEPWSCHQIYKVFDELYSNIYGRREVNAERIVFLRHIALLCEKYLEKIADRKFASYRLTQYFLMYLVRELLLQSEKGSKIIQNPALAMSDQKKMATLEAALGSILGGIIVDLNLMAKEAGDSFDYKADLKSPQRVPKMVSQLIATYQRDVAREKAPELEKALNFV